MQRYLLVLAVFLCMLTACERDIGAPPAIEMNFSAPAGSLAPNFTRSPDGVVYLSWLETEGGFSRLMFARWLGEKWSEKRLIAEGSDWFVNWADFPSLIALDDRRLIAHWLVRSSPGAYAYDVRLGQSVDGGETWSELGVLHNDQTNTEHGFVAFYPANSDGMATAGVVWLDGRNLQEPSAGDHAGGHVEGHIGGQRGMSLRHARLGADGAVMERAEIDPLTCDCCQTAAVPVGEDVLVAYRDREFTSTTEGDGSEIRDIMLMRRSDGNWQRLGYVHADNWEITGCPVNGPAMAAVGNKVAIGWYTEAAGRPLVQAGLSSDGGFSFKTFEVSDDSPMGRVSVTPIASAFALSWLARVDDTAEIRMRLIDSDAGSLMPTQTLTRVKADRAAGFPKLIAADDALLLAWTEVLSDASKDTRVRVGRLPLKPRRR